MLLREFVYFNEVDADQQDQRRYDPEDDKSILTIKDTRKTRLTLRMINKLRQAGEAREQETMEDLVLVRAMYANPAPEAAVAQ
jgi:DNA-binding transcriptional MerR regulator